MIPVSIDLCSIPRTDTLDFDLSDGSFSYTLVKAEDRGIRQSIDAMIAIPAAVQVIYFGSMCVMFSAESREIASIDGFVDAAGSAERTDVYVTRTVSRRLF